MAHDAANCGLPKGAARCLSLPEPCHDLSYCINVAQLPEQGRERGLLCPAACGTHSFAAVKMFTLRMQPDLEACGDASNLMLCMALNVDGGLHPRP